MNWSHNLPFTTNKFQVLNSAISKHCLPTVSSHKPANYCSTHVTEAETENLRNGILFLKPQWQINDKLRLAGDQNTPRSSISDLKAQLWVFCYFEFSPMLTLPFLSPLLPRINLPDYPLLITVSSTFPSHHKTL